MNRVALAAILVTPLLACCGEDAPTKGPGSEPDLVGLEDIARGRPSREEVAEQVSRAVERGMGDLREQMGGDPQVLAQKAAAMAQRPLTADDVETYLALAPRMRSLQGPASQDPEARAALEKHGLTGLEWGVLVSRIQAARIALKLAPDTVKDPKVLADMAVVRPFEARLKESLTK